MDDQGKRRPDPDRLLEQIGGGATTRGKLKIYLGMAAGVGKTYAMLKEGAAAKARGVDLVVGYLEPHGRQETERLADGMEILPPRIYSHAGIELKEFDLDAALARKPEVILVDELAHSNAPGARHRKRWQDIEELLGAGISVNTTVNIQHLESVKDVVAQISGILVHETVPDTVFTTADEIEVIDLPPADLLQRLQDGKIYPPDRVNAALSNFFKEGNLIALRELVLRHSARSVDAQMQRFRRRHEVQGIWPVHERLLVLVGPSKMAASLVRYAQRLATMMDAELFALTLESPAFAKASEEDRMRALEALRIAESVGARTFSHPSQDFVADTLSFARDHNITGIVVGKPVRPRWKDLFHRRFVDELLRNSLGFSVHVISAAGVPTDSDRKPSGRSSDRSLKPLFETVLVTAAATALSALIAPALELSNLIMIYLLAVTWIASRFSYREAIAGSVLAVGAFDFFFVPPRFTFSVSDAQYLITFAIMLLVSIVISHLTQQLKGQARVTAEREQQTGALFALSRDLLRIRSSEEADSLAKTHIKRALGWQATILSGEPSEMQSTAGASSPTIDALASWVRQYNRPAGLGTDTLPGCNAFFLPLGNESECRAVLKVTPPMGTPITIRERKLIEAYSAQLSLALERLNSEEIADDARLAHEREGVKNILLSSISHDLRTPLTVIAGASGILLEPAELEEGKRRELLLSIKQQADRLGAVVRNVLDLTRLEAGMLEVRKDWYSVEELVGAALGSTRPVLGELAVEIGMPKELPLLKVDGVLMEQLFVNLFENVARHAAHATKLTVSGAVEGEEIVIRFDDDGPGFPKDGEERVFEKLYSVSSEKGGGIGLGLTICRAIVTAHGGSIRAQNLPMRGARIEIHLPIEEAGDES